MKSSHKFYAATGGLLVAALMGFAGAHATEPVTAEDNLPPIEPVTSQPAESAQGNFSVELGEDTTKAASAEKEAAESQKSSAAETPGKTVVPESSAPEAEEATESPAEATEAKSATESESEATAGKEAITDSKKDAEATEAEEVAPAKDSSEAEAEDLAKEDAETSAAGADVKEAANFVPVTYVAPRHSSLTSGADTDEVTPPDPNAQSPLLTMAKTENEAPAPEKSANGESVVVWFELPQPAGPALVPGQSTPLLNAAVSEAAASSTTNANVVSAPAAQKGAAVNQAAAKQRVGASSVNAENGTLSRSLARTGSIAQYATLLSAGALILGVAFLVGAVATSRRNSRLVDAE